MTEEKLKKLIQDIKITLRIIIALFLFVVGIYIGIIKAIHIQTYSIILIIFLLIGIIVTLAIILSELEEDK